MKNKITLIVTLLLSAVIVLSVFAQGKKENKGQNNKEQHQGKGNDKGKGDKGNGKENPGEKGNKNNDNGKGNGKDNGNDNNNGAANEDNRGKGNDKDNGKVKENYKWDNETFKDRDRIRKQMDKVTLCHKFNRADEPAVTIRVSQNAMKAHMNHGDVVGECPVADNTRYSKHFIDRRVDYYQVLQDGQEQVLYSRSILDYALERLTGAKTQLVTLQRTNAPAADVERKRLLVVDLENNVSLLQTLVGVTANLVADRLMN